MRTRRLIRRSKFAALAVTATLIPVVALAPAPAQAATYPYNLTSSKLKVGFGADGSIQSLKIANDLYDTEYVMNPDVAPEQGRETNPAYKQWLGNLIFNYALGSGTPTVNGVGSTPWTSARTSMSADSRSVTSDGSSVTVTYTNSATTGGIKNFTVVEKFSLDPDGSLVWNQKVTNTSDQQLTIGDWGVPIPGNELWKNGDSIYETRAITHSYVGRDSSYVTLQRPSGQGPAVLITGDSATGSGFEYQDRWRTEEVGNTSWAWNANNESSMVKGLNVYYPYSMAIQKTNRGYLGSTAAALAPNASKSLTYRITSVASDAARQDSLYDQDAVDATVVPGMVVPYDQKAQIALRLKGTITGIDARNLNDLGGASPTNPTVTFSRSNGAYRIYTVGFDRTQLGKNNLTIRYNDSAGRARQSVEQFDVVDKTSDAIDAHAKFMVDKMQWNTSDGITTDDIRYKTFDDWMMNASDGAVPSSSNAPRGRRNEYYGYFGLGDDWGLPHGEFLAEKLVSRPVQNQVQALDDYLEKAVWEHLMGNTLDDPDPQYLIYDFWEQGKPGSLNTTPAYRGYAYAHIYNTFYSMYKIAKQYPSLINYVRSAKSYLSIAYRIFKEMYDGPVAYNYGTGVMGELTTPDLVASLRAEGMTAEAADIDTKMARKYDSFKAQKYPYGSEYSFDNTGEEAVYMLAKTNVNNDNANALRVMREIVAKTRATRGQMPVWYWYADPTTITGENWWQFQYSTVLAGYTMDDYINHTSALETGANTVSSAQRAVLQRLNYAAKTANLATINSGQISNNPANIGASAWTYQSEKGNLGTLGTGGGSNVQLLNGWRGMTGESDLGLWGILQTLSADVVTDDPVFGTVGYGATVTGDQYSYTVVPTDGLRRRLNMVTQQLSVSLDSDQYTQAIVSKTNNDLRLDMRNVSGTAHTGSLNVSGLKQGTYGVIVNGTLQRKINNYSVGTGKLVAPAKVDYSAPAGSSFVVHLVSMPADANQAPVVNAGPDQSGIVQGIDPINLTGAVSDDNLGNPNGTLTYSWSTASAPSGGTATFSDTGSLQPSVSVSTAGTYVFRLTASDGAATSSDTVSVAVTARQPMPANWVNYTFNSSSNGTVADTSGNGNTLSLKGAAAVVQDAGNSVLRLDGSNGTYAKLPDDIMTRCISTCTVSMRFKVDRVQAFDRLLDFGSSTQKYMFLTSSLGGKLGFAISTSGNGAESQITSSYTVPVNTYVTAKLQFQKNSGAGWTGRLYANGNLVGQNTALANGPSDLGRTNADYLGKSQFADPYLPAYLDDISINGDLR